MTTSSLYTQDRNGNLFGALHRQGKGEPLPEPRFLIRRNMIIDRDFEYVLERTGLYDFDAIMNCEQGVACSGGPPGRFTVTVAIPDASGTTALYLTRYEETLAAKVLKRGIISRKRCSAIKEWRTILALRDCNLPVAVPIAVGMRRGPALVTESFLVTLGPAHLTTVRSILEGRGTRQPAEENVKRKRRFLASLAVMLRRLHEEGFKHRDLYFSQILVNWENAQNPVVALGNAQSVRKRSPKTHYWQINDLAALNGAAPEAVFSQADRLWFLQHYDSTLASDRSFIAILNRKTKRIRNRTGPSGKRIVDLLRRRKPYALTCAR